LYIAIKISMWFWIKEEKSRCCYSRGCWWSAERGRMDAELNAHCLVAISFLLLLDNDNYVQFDRRCGKGTWSIQRQSAVKWLGTISVEEEFQCEGEETCSKISEKGAIQQHYKPIISIVHAPDKPML
jgi:hypothetical protein